VVNKSEITPALVRRLVAAQFPQWSDLPVTRIELDGWDNATFRLGREMSVRLPSGDAYTAQVDKEHRWLPALAAQLPLPIPQPLARARRAKSFPARGRSTAGWRASPRRPTGSPTSTGLQPTSPGFSTRRTALTPSTALPRVRIVTSEAGR
jgi:hypothetical protein